MMEPRWRVQPSDPAVWTLHCEPERLIGRGAVRIMNAMIAATAAASQPLAGTVANARRGDCRAVEKHWCAYDKVS